MKTIRLLAFLALAATMGCGGALCDVPSRAAEGACSPTQDSGGKMAMGMPVGTGALLATRISSLAEFKTIVDVEYFADSSADSAGDGASLVRLLHCSNGHMVTSILESGLSQDDVMNVKKGGFLDRLNLALRAPYAVANRADLERVYILARRVPLSFGEGDPAFYDLAETSVAHINTADLAFNYVKDTSEKGYINSFNHITAQAFISSIFSEELADFVADLHERKNMRELTTGKFTEDQLSNPEDNPVDNYVDMINNEWGQELGKQLKEKYHISRTTWWTPALLADYLNDIQSYYSWAFQIGFKPFRPADELVVRFSTKINVVMNNRYG